MQKTTPNILKSQWFFDILIDHIHYKKQNTTVFCFSISNKKQLGKPPKTFESKPNILSKVFFVLLEFFVFCLVCLLIHMVAICVRMLAYLIVPGKSNFDQRFSLKSLRTM
jgi:hypothetical protein